jgi:D-alanyl-D-alanine carboxypeptidase
MPFRIASVTKTFTAATVWRLIEAGRVDLDAPLSTTPIPKRLLELLTADGYDTAAITVRHLLTHTSGIADYADNDSGAASGPYGAAVLADPTHTWTAEEQIRFAMDNHTKLSEPGVAFHYSDTGYVLLGQLIEQVTGTTYAAAMRSLLRFDELGMNSTYLESLEPTPTGSSARMTQYLGDMPINDISPSIDLYGGGGLVSTTHDLAVFFRTLGRGEVFDRPETFDRMTATTAADSPQAAAGIYRTTIAGTTCWLHTGFWGVLALTCPQLDVTVARTLNQSSTEPTYDDSALVEQILMALGIDPG